MLNIPTKVPGDTHFTTEFNSYVGEDKNFCTDVNITLDGSNSHQLGQSTAAYAVAGNYFTDTGVANAMVLTSAQYNFQTPQNYYDGMLVRCLPAATNTGATNMNVAGLGNKAVKLSGGTIDPAAGDIIAGVMTEFYYSAAHNCMIYLGTPENSITAVPLNYFSPGGFLSSDNGTVMTFGPGACADSSNQQMIYNPSPFSKDYTATWASGTGNGGVPTAVTLNPNTDYYDFVISKPDGTVDFGLDTSIIAANLMADASAFGFTRYRRVRAHLTQLSSTNIETMHQVGRNFYYIDLRTDVGISSGGTSVNQVYAMSLPLIPVLGIFYFTGYAVSSTGNPSPKFNLYNSQDYPLSINQNNIVANSQSVSPSNRSNGTGEFRVISIDRNLGLKIWDTGSTSEISLSINTGGWVDDQI